MWDAHQIIPGYFSWGFIFQVRPKVQSDFPRHQLLFPESDDFIHGRLRETGKASLDHHDHPVDQTRLQNVSNVCVHTHTVYTVYSMRTVCLYVCDYTYIHYITLHYITLHYVYYIAYIHVHGDGSKLSSPGEQQNSWKSSPYKWCIYIYIYIFFVCIVVRISAYKTNETRWRQPTSFQTPIWNRSIWWLAPRWICFHWSLQKWIVFVLIGHLGTPKRRMI